MSKPVTIDDTLVCKYLAENPVRSKPGRQGRQGKRVEYAEALLKEFGVEVLRDALQTRQDPITLRWYVDQLLTLLHSPANECSSSTKLDILRELKQLMVLGAVQDSHLAKHIADKERGEGSKTRRAALPDPFALVKESA